MEAVKYELQKINPIGYCVAKRDWLIYTTTLYDTPHIVLEIAKQRKMAFESAGVKLFHSIDLDCFDTVVPQQSQMFIWDSQKEAIVGGYRYSYNMNIAPAQSPMGEAFLFTDEFASQNWIQLGRSFLSIDYQKNHYGVFALMNGLGCLFAKATNPEGFFGKITIPVSYENNGATDLIVAFCRHYWLDGSYLGFVKNTCKKESSSLVDLFIKHVDLHGKHQELNHILKEEYKLPGIPILKIYDALVDGFKSIHYLGAFIHTDFGESTEIGMAIHKNNFNPKAVRAHIEPYL
jgi:hypothetical protein